MSYVRPNLGKCVIKGLDQKLGARLGFGPGTSPVTEGFWNKGIGDRLLSHCHQICLSIFSVMPGSTSGSTRKRPGVVWHCNIVSFSFFFYWSLSFKLSADWNNAREPPDQRQMDNYTPLAFISMRVIASHWKWGEKCECRPRCCVSITANQSWSR